MFLINSVNSSTNRSTVSIIIRVMAVAGKNIIVRALLSSTRIAICSIARWHLTSMYHVGDKHQRELSDAFNAARFGRARLGPVWFTIKRIENRFKIPIFWWIVNRGFAKMSKFLKKISKRIDSWIENLFKSVQILMLCAIEPSIILQPRI